MAGIKNRRTRCVIAAAGIAVILWVSAYLFFSLNHEISEHTVPADAPQEASDTDIERLKLLGYLTWVFSGDTIDSVGVVLNNTEKSYDGLNLYNSRNLAKANLMDDSGAVLHTWSVKIEPDDTWHHIELCANGDLLAIVKDKRLVMMDWDSNVKWVRNMRFHHDVAVGSNHNIFSLVSEDAFFSLDEETVPIVDNLIQIISYDGVLLERISLAEIFKNDAYVLKQISRVKDREEHFDVFHTNSIEIINRDIPGICERGAILVSFRTMDLIAIIDVNAKKVLWEWGPGELSRQHHPSLLANDNILVFDNGEDKKRSRIIEVNPFTERIEWEYTANPPEDFYSPTRGACQRLPNGNTLITDSDSGHVFEVTRDREIVWDFYNPEVKTASKTRATIYRLMRIVNMDNYPGLKDRLTESGPSMPEQQNTPILDKDI